MAAAVRFRIKGTRIYVKPVASQAYETVGTGRRSIAMRAPNYGPNAAIQYAGTQLRDQSRDAVRKNGLAAAIPALLTSNMIGTGIVPQPPSAKTREVWRDWTDQASADETLDFYGLQAQIARAMVVSGECFVRLRTRRPEDGLAVPLQLQALEGDYVPFEKNEDLGNGSYIRQGIEFNRIGRRVAYWMYKQHPGDASVLPAVDNQPVRVPASEVLHVYDAINRPGMIRGEPWLTRALAKLKDLDSYDDAELVRKKVSALLVAFVRRNVPEGTTLEELKEGWGDDAEIADGVGGVSLEPATLQYLAPGEEVEWSRPQDVGGQYEVFMREQKRALAVSAGLLYEQLTGDYGELNDRTWRAAFNEFKRRCEMWQHHIIVFQCCRPVWTRWCAMARLSGALSEADTPKTVKWVAQAWPYINPKQDIEATQLEIRAGLASRSEKASERGRDTREIDREQAEDNASADENGVKYDSDGRNPAKSGGGAGQNGAPGTDDAENQGKEAA